MIKTLCTDSIALTYKNHEAVYLHNKNVGYNITQYIEYWADEYKDDVYDATGLKKSIQLVQGSMACKLTRGFHFLCSFLVSPDPLYVYGV